MGHSKMPSKFQLNQGRTLMKWFGDLSTMKKLGLGFGLMGVLLVVVATLGLSTGASSNAAFERASHRDVAGLDVTYQTIGDVLAIARGYRQGMIVSDPQAKED